MNSDAAHNGCKVRSLYEKLFSLNMGFAITYALFVYEGGCYLPVHSSKIVATSLETFARMLRGIASLVVSGRTRSEHLRSEIIREAVFLGLTLGIALLLYLLTRFLLRTAGRRRVLTSMSGLIALIAVPACWLYIVHATWPAYERQTFWVIYGYVSSLEIAVASGLLYFVRNQAIWRGTAVVVLHYIFWVFVMGARSGPTTNAAMLLSIVFPCSGLAWLRYVRALPSQQTPERS